MIEATSVIMILSGWCNLRCPHCIEGDDSGNLDVNEITSDQIITFLNTLPNIGTVHITGGEPLGLPVYEKTYKIVEYAKSRDLSVRINTNGTVGLPSIFPYTTSKTIFQVSLDGLKEGHDSIRSKGSFDKTVAFIKDRVAEGYRVSVMRVIMKSPDYTELDEYISFVKSLGVMDSDIVIRLLHPTGRAKGTSIRSELIIPELKKFLTLRGVEFKKFITKCNSFQDVVGRIAFDQYGRIIPCPILGKYKFGTIFDYDQTKVKKEMVDRIGNCTCAFPDGYNN